MKERPLREPVGFLIFSGSLRGELLNSQLAELVAVTIEENGRDVDVASMRDFDAPSYDDDRTAAGGSPAGVEEFRRRLDACDGFVVASPKYDASVPRLVEYLGEHPEPAIDRVR